ncbi:hypothetical protein ABIC78_002769 [Novosphingobium sp. 1529]|uniref:hypothetical protein n=1 Tax=Novosphingobium sp. 1529 TaxID=3156424 RepID=UPI00339AC0CB
MTSKLTIYKWELETLVNELLIVPKRKRRIKGQWRELDCSRYDALQDMVRVLRRLENADAGVRLKRKNVLEEMPRISARQFDWQRGWFNIPQFYRSTFIYGQGASADYFEATHGLTINEFSLIGFVLHTYFWEYPIFMRSFDWASIPLTSEKFERALRLLCSPVVDTRQKASGIHRRFQSIAHQPSVLRQFPCISFGAQNERIRSPLPQLILERVTAGVFYDIVGAGRKVREEYGRRFEDYSLRYLQASLPGINWQSEHTYRVRKEEFKTPDILWTDGRRLRLAIECKATRMSVEARYADNPLSVRGYDDLIKAVFQLWRYFSHCRRGLTGVSLANNVTGLVLTLDSWLLMANALIQDVLAAATQMAAERDAEIIEEDRLPILFCASTDLESTLATATEDSFANAISKAVDEHRHGWALSSSHQEVRPGNPDRKPFPFRDDMARLLPWWNWIKERRDRSPTFASAPQN